MGGDDATRVFLGIILGRALRARLTSYTNAECNRVSVLQFRPSAYYSRISPLGEGRFTAGAARRVFLFLRNISPLRAAACEATRGGPTRDEGRASPRKCMQRSCLLEPPARWKLESHKGPQTAGLTASHLPRAHPKMEP